MDAKVWGGLHKEIDLKQEKKTENQKNVPYKIFLVGTEQIGVDDLEVSKAGSFDSNLHALFWSLM